MDQEITVADKYKDIISEIISIEEIQQFLSLREKIAAAEAAVVKAEQAIEDQMTSKPAPTGPVPYYVTLTLTTDVVIPSTDPASAPEPIENKSQSYVIEFIDKAYETLINRIYDKLTDVITEACKELVKVPEEPKDVDTTTETRSE